MKLSGLHSSLLMRLIAISCLGLVISVTPQAHAQDEETQSVGDAARAARARRAAQANQDEHRPPQPAVSITTLVAWQIAGISMPDILNELQLRGVSFPADDAHLNSLKTAQLAPELLAALPKVPSHPDASSSSELAPALVSAAQAFHAKDYVAARHHLEGLAQQTKDASLYAALGNVDALSKDMPSAKEAFLQSERFDTAFAYPHVRMAEIYYHSEQSSQMTAEARKALVLQPNNGGARKYIALAMGMETIGSGGSSDVAVGGGGGGGEGLNALHGGLNQGAKDLNNQAIEMAAEQDWTNAEKAYKDAIEMDPQVALYYYNLGNLYDKWSPEHTNQALAAYKQAKMLAPRNLAIRQNIGYTLCHNNRHAEAVQEFREVLAIDLYWNMARPCLYESLYALGKVKEAYQVMADYTKYKALDDSGDDGEADADFHTNTGPKL